MSLGVRKFVGFTKILLAGVTVFCVSWIASVNEWHTGVSWSRSVVQENVSTMRTIIGYSEAKQAELDRPSPVSCKRLPVLPKIPYINRTWSPGSEESSWQHVEGTSVSLYAAYYDDRLPQKYIRILAMFHGRKISSEPLYCQTRSTNNNDDTVEVVTAKPLEIWWKDWDNTSFDIFTPLLLSCPLTDTLKGPSIVSLVTQPCDDPTNGFRLNTKNHKYIRNFTICVKDLNFQRDISSNLIEWIEINRLLGVDVIDIYIDRLSKENEDILMFYSSQGFVRLFRVPIKYKYRSLWQRRRDHVVTYNDCLYRNIIESKFIVPLDLDEIVLPKIANTLTELIIRLTNRGWSNERHSAILVRNVFFFDFLQVYNKRDDVRINLNNKLISKCGKMIPVPKISRHIVSSAYISPIGRYSKSMMYTKKVLTAFNHYPLASLGTDITGWSAPYDEVQINHYKESCNSSIVADCDVYTRKTRLDRTAGRFTKPLLEAISTVMCKLNSI